MPATPSKFALADEKLSASHRPCGMCRYLQTLPAGDVEYINWMLTQPIDDKGHTHIADVIVDVGGPKIDPKVISRHRERHLER